MQLQQYMGGQAQDGRQGVQRGDTASSKHNRCASIAGTCGVYGAAAASAVVAAGVRAVPGWQQTLPQSAGCTRSLGRHTAGRGYKKSLHGSPEVILCLLS